MRVSYNWLQEYVEINISPEELADKLTFSGVAVENIEYPGEGIEKIVTAKVDEVLPHPNADKLVICNISYADEKVQIVTGAPNVAENQVVVLALVGAKLPGGMKIKRSKLRGVESSGMVCSAQELGLDPENFPEDQRDGIIVLPEDTPLGVDIKKVLGLDDVILELELTPNRADCLSMVGVAREVAAILGTEFRPPVIDVPETEETIDGQVTVKIEEPELCGRYIGRLIKNIKIGPSPDWMQRRLRAAGVRPISNIVDVTNYIMMELGQPLHAFDYDKVQEKTIIVRRAQEKEELITLDDVKRELNPEMLVIADAKVPVALAGVMGGLESEITEETSTVLLESAFFNGASIRRTSNKLALRSESSLRFEKGVDPNGCLRAANRAAQLISEMGAGEVVSRVVDNYPELVEEAKITLRPDRVNQILGVDIPENDMKNILERLQFDVDDSEGEITVTVPTYRGDITREVDLVEEIVRLYGYDKIPTVLPKGESTQGKKTFAQNVEDKVKDIFVGLGVLEVITMSFINPKSFDLINLPTDSNFRNVVKVQNPISEEQGVMRTTLIPGLADVVARNLARKNTNLAIFEMGKIFIPIDGEELPNEKRYIGAALTGQLPSGWNQKAQDIDFYYVKGIVETLFEELGIIDYSFMADSEHPAYHPGRTAKVLINNDVVGMVGEAHPELMENYRINSKTYFIEINIDELINAAVKVKTYKSLPKYPAVERDMAIVVKEEIPAAELYNEIVTNGGALLKEVRLFDVYTGKQIEQGNKSLAYAFLFQASDRTLTDDEVNNVYNKIQDALETKFDAKLRS